MKLDSIVTRVIDRFKTRAEIGNKKYGTDLDRKDLNSLEWLQHLQDELHDAYLYSEKLKEEYPLEIKQLMNQWVDEKQMAGAKMPVEFFIAGFVAYLNEKKLQ
jgi:hypothetical protein